MSASVNSGSQSDNRSVLTARAVIFVFFFDFFLLLPILSPYARDLGASDALIGFIVGAYSVTNLVGNIAAGAFLDKWGRRKPMLIGLIATALALVGYAFAGNPQQLLAARAVHGFATAILAPGAFAMLGDATTSARRAGVMGVSGAFIAAAAVLGPLIAGITKDSLSAEVVFVGGAFLMVVTAGVFWLWARETTTNGQSTTSQESTRGRDAGYRGLLLNSSLLLASVAALGLTIGLGTLVTHLPLSLEAQGESASRSGAAFTSFAIVALVLMASPVNRLSDRHGRLIFLVLGLGIIAASLFVLATLPGFIGAVLGMAIYGLGFGLLFPAATALVADAVGTRQRGMAFGIFYAVYSLGVVIGSGMSGLTAEVFGDISGVPFAIGGVSVAVAAVIVFAGRVRRLGQNAA